MAKDTREYIWKDKKHHLWFPLSFVNYKLTNEKLYIEQGLFNTQYDELLIYRIVDIKLVRNLWQKIFGTGTIQLITKGDSQHEILLINVKKSLEVKEMLSNMAEKARTDKNVVGSEMVGPGCATHNHGYHDIDGDGTADF